MGVCSSGNNNGDGFDSFAAGRGKRRVGRQAGRSKFLLGRREVFAAMCERCGGMVEMGCGECIVIGTDSGSRRWTARREW